MKQLYLACPYSCKIPIVRHFVHLWRWLWVSWASYHLMKAGYAVFSPVSHSVPISWFQSKKDNCHDFWLSQDDVWLKECHYIRVLGLRGWDKSTGVKWEIRRGKYFSIPIDLIHPRTLKILETL